MERGAGEFAFHGAQSFSFGRRKVLETGVRDGRTAVWMCFMPLSCALDNGENSEFYAAYVLSE